MIFFFLKAAFLGAVITTLIPRHGASQSCASATNSMNDNELIEASNDFLNSVFNKCDAGDPNICKKIEIEDFVAVESVTRFVDYRELRETEEYVELLEECRTEQDGTYIPVEVDMELFTSEDFRVWNIKRLYCLPKGCSNNVDDLSDALLSFLGDDYKEWSRNGRLDFHPLDEPASEANCDIAMMEWAQLSFTLRVASNKYMDKYVADCHNIDSTLCSNNAVYRSLGEWDRSTYTMQNNYDSSEFSTLKGDCESRGGEMCSMDMLFTFQYHGEERGALDRADVNIMYEGWPHCFDAACSYEDKLDFAENNDLDRIFGVLTDVRHQRRSLRASSVPITRALMTSPKETKLSSGANNKMPPTEDEGSADGDSQEQNGGEDINLSAQRDFILDLENIDESTVIMTGFPYEFFTDKNAAQQEDENEAPEGRVFNSYTGSRSCGENSDSCFSRLINLCLRPLATGTIDGGDDGGDEDEGEDGGKNILGDIDGGGLISLVPQP